MTEVVGWVVVFGLAVAIAGIYILWNQIRKHSRDTTEIMLDNNRLMLAHLNQLANPASTGSEPTASVVLEKRCGGRRRCHWTPENDSQSRANQRRSPGRRVEDFAGIGHTGYLNL
jgi:hypothetical protein